MGLVPAATDAALLRRGGRGYQRGACPAGRPVGPDGRGARAAPRARACCYGPRGRPQRRAVPRVLARGVWHAHSLSPFRGSFAPGRASDLQILQGGTSACSMCRARAGSSLRGALRHQKRYVLCREACPRARVACAGGPAVLRGLPHGAAPVVRRPGPGALGGLALPLLPLRRLRPRRLRAPGGGGVRHPAGRTPSHSADCMLDWQPATWQICNGLLSLLIRFRAPCRWPGCSRRRVPSGRGPCARGMPRRCCWCPRSPSTRRCACHAPGSPVLKQLHACCITAGVLPLREALRS